MKINTIRCKIISINAYKIDAHCANNNEQIIVSKSKNAFFTLKCAL